MGFINSLMTNPKAALLGLLISIPGLIIALAMHEFAHGFAAYKMGDNTAKYYGRLTLNPLHHIDPWGTVCLFLFGFGWAKPVPINPYNFNKRRAGIITVSLAGPLMNFIIALLSEFGLMALVRFDGIAFANGFLYQALSACKILNVGLMCFNLIPIPPLDGSKVLLEFLPYRSRETFYQLERYSAIILVLLLVTDVIAPALNTMGSFVYNIIDLLVGLVF